MVIVYFSSILSRERQRVRRNSLLIFGILMVTHFFSSNANIYCNFLDEYLTIGHSPSLL